MKKLFPLLSVCLLLSLFFVNPAAAQNECTIIYGGGEIDCEATVTATANVTPTTKPEQPATPSANSEQTTKGGLPVYDPQPASTTPDTGPEILGLAALIPAAGLGYYLRRKTS